MKKSNRPMDVIHSGMVLWQDTQQNMPVREVPARLNLTKDQLSVQIYSTNTEVVAVLASQNDSTVDLSLRTVNVPKTKDGLGFSIKGGTDNNKNYPIVISKVLPNMPAAKTGQVFVGDIITEVDGIATESKSHEDVVQMLKDSSGEHITLTLRRDSKINTVLRPGILIPPGDLNLNYKSALKTEEKQDESTTESHVWNTVNRIPLPMAMISQYLWGTDKIRSNAFEVKSVDGHSSGIIHCEDPKALEQWLKQIDDHICTLNKRSIRMSNKYLHASEKISYIGWLEERMPDGYFDDPKKKWEKRFVILKGAHLCFFDSPPLSAEELDKCLFLYKIYETALKTAIKPNDRREHVFSIDTAHETVHYLSFGSIEQLQRFECAYYNCVYKAINTLQARTFACSHDERPAGLVLDIRDGISCYDIPSKRYIWQYRFSELESSSDDGKMRIQFNFKNKFSLKDVDVRDIESDNVLTLVFTLHSFYVTKIMGIDAEFLQNLPLS